MKKKNTGTFRETVIWLLQKYYAQMTIRSWLRAFKVFENTDTQSEWVWNFGWESRDEWAIHITLVYWLSIEDTALSLSLPLVYNKRLKRRINSHKPFNVSISITCSFFLNLFEVFFCGIVKLGFLVNYVYLICSWSEISDQTTQICKLVSFSHSKPQRYLLVIVNPRDFLFYSSAFVGMFKFKFNSLFFILFFWDFCIVGSLFFNNKKLESLFLDNSRQYTT